MSAEDMATLANNTFNLFRNAEFIMNDKAINLLIMLLYQQPLKIY